MNIVSKTFQSMNAEIRALTSRQPTALYIGWTGHGNLGDEVLLECVRDLFRDDLFLYDKPYVGRGMSLRLREGQFDCAILGGGTLLFRADDYLNRLASAKAQRKYVFGSGVANIDFWDNEVKKPISSGVQRWVDYINENVSYLGVRGPVSEELLRRHGVEKPVEILGDPVLYLCERELKPKERTNVLGVNVGLSQNMSWGLSDEKFLKNYQAGLLALAKKGWLLKFFPVWDRDLSTCIWMARSLAQQGAKTDVYFFQSAEEYMSEMHDVDIFVGEKLHSVILAACTHTPVVMIEYRPKCRDFMKSMGLDEFSMRGDTLTAERLLDKVEQCSAQHDVLRHKIFSEGTKYRHRIERAAARIADEVRSL